MKLAARWRDPDTCAEAAAAWQRTRSLRLDGLLDDDDAAALADALRELPHPLVGGCAPDFAFQYGAYVAAPEDDCDHVWCRFGAWWWQDGVAFVAALTGMTLAPPADRRVMATLFRRGGFLDPHNDHDGARRCAYVLGLTRDTWPAADGGHLEFLAMRGDDLAVVERRAPGWNTLDLFDVTGTTCLHQVPILTRDVERRAITGWFY